MSKHPAHTSDDDAALVASWRKGELASFEALVSRHLKQMLNIAFRLTGNYEDACEVVQDAFVAAHRESGSFRGEVRFSTWLAGFTVSHSRNPVLQGKAKRKNGAPPVDVTPAEKRGSVHEWLAMAPTTLEQLERAAIADKLQGCISALSADLREVIVLSDVQGFSREETCAILKAREGTVRSRQFRAREQVTECLKGGGRAVMEHGEIRRKLAAYLDNAVAVEEKGEIKKHLAGCGSCRVVLADLEHTIGHLRNLPSAEPPPWLTDRIMAKVREKAAPSPNLWRRLFLPPRVKLSLAVLASVAVCAAGYYLARTVAPPVPPPGPIPTPGEEAPRPAVTPGGTLPPSPPPTTSPVPSLPPSSGVSPAPSVARPVPLPHAAEIPAPSPTLPARPSTEPELQTGDGLVPERDDAYLPGGEKKTAAGRMSRGKREGADVTLQAGEVKITLDVSDPATAAEAIEQTVVRLGGAINGSAYGEENHVLYAQLAARKLPELIDRLGRIGAVQEQPQAPEGTGGTVGLVIRW